MFGSLSLSITAGSPVALATGVSSGMSDTSIELSLRAPLTNAGIIYIGDSGVDSSSFPLYPGDVLSINNKVRLTELFADASSSNDKLTGIYVIAD